jgi:hypothetical protein
MNDDEILDDFKSWIRHQPMYVISEDKDLRQEQIDDAPFDYINDFCIERKYGERTEEELLNWILLRNEVYVFLEESGIL